MSTLRVSTIQDTAGSNSSTPSEIASGRAKAWVNFNGTGVVAIRAQYNVSSITDNGVGDYTVNFTNALADTNYAFLAFVCKDNEANDNVIYPRSTPNSTYTTGSVRFYSNYGASGGVGNFDTPKAYVAIFR